MVSYKEQYSFDKRLAEARAVIQKYPDKLPVIVEPATGKTDIPLLDKKKFLVPNQLSIGQFMYVLRKRLVLPSDKALFLFVNNSLPTSSTYIAELYRQYADSDGFLYMTYCGESTFGKGTEGAIATEGTEGTTGVASVIASAIFEASTAVSSSISIITQPSSFTLSSK